VHQSGTEVSDDGVEKSKNRLQFNPTQDSHEGDTTMITKTALIAILTLGTVAVASASEFDGNLQNRYPQAATSQGFQSRNVALTGGNTVAIRGESYLDRASRSSGGGY